MTKTFPIEFPDGRIEELTIPQYVAYHVVEADDFDPEEHAAAISDRMPRKARELIDAGEFTADEYNAAVIRERPVTCQQCEAPVKESADLCGACGSYLYGDHHA